MICISGIGARSGFAALITNKVTDFHTLDTGQCFPLYIYDGIEEETDDIEHTQGGLFENLHLGKSNKNVTHAITDEGLNHFKEAYPNEDILKDDIFYYVYGLLHSEDYRERYEDNFSKELPRIPRVKTADNFWSFSKAGRELAELHINYEQVEPYPVQFEGGSLLIESFGQDDYKVQQMKFAKGKNGLKHDKTRVIYNHKITMEGIPLEAYGYVVNGRPALEWVMERQIISEHKDSGIINDANIWATETMKNASSKTHSSGTW